MSRPSERARSGAHANAAYFFEPRAGFIIAVVALVCFGILMIYSSSSVNAMYEVAPSDAEVPTIVKSASYLRRQVLYAAVGVCIAVFLAMTDYHIWSRDLLILMGIVTIAILILVFVPGIRAPQGGSSRWIRLNGSGTRTLQPSEFAKVSLVLIAAQLGQELDEWGPTRPWLAKLLVFLAIPLVLVFVEPDKGTMAIIGFTLIIMLWYSGVDTKVILVLCAIAAAVLVAYTFKDKYALRRVVAMLRPDLGADDESYQINQGYYAFGRGGVLGVGLGMSHQKYGYLPEAETDYIFAIIGEETGLVGTLSVLLTFALLIRCGYEIARRASDLDGRLIAAGFSTLMGVQLLVNICGVTGLVPASGKPIPFISYGGSSIVACLMMAGLVVSVSRHSELPETIYDERRSRLQLYDESHDATSLRVLSGGGFGDVPVGGGTASSPSVLRAERAMIEGLGGSISYNANGTRRINLGSSPSERLRSRGGSGTDERRR